MIEKLKNGKPSSASIKLLIGVTVTSMVLFGNWLGYQPPVSSGHNPNHSAGQVILPPAELDKKLNTADWHSTHPPRPASGVLAGSTASAFHPPARFGQVSLGFERNQGQANPKVKYLTRGKGYALFLNQHDITLAVSRPSAPTHHQLGEIPAPKPSSPAIIRLELAGSQPAVKITGEHPRSEQINYLTGNDPRAWRREVPSYNRVRYTGIYPGIDAVYYGADHQLEYDFVVSPGASPHAIRLRFSGVEQAELDSNGNLVLSIETGKLVQTKPVVYQEILGVRHLVAGSYRVLAHNEIGFEVPVYDRTKPLVIDPILQYSSFLGGDETEAGYRIAVSPAGNAYVVGSTLSASFGSQSPTSVGLSGNRDVFVAKLNPTGDGLEYLTFLGGSAADFGHSLVVDSLGQVTVAGITESTDFPVQNARQAVSAGDADGFVARLNAAGNTLIYSSYFGGSRGDVVNAVTIDTQGAIYLTGSTESEDFPTQGPMQIQIGGRRDAFVTKLNPANPPQTQLVYSAFVGGSDMEVGLAIAVQSSNVYLAGSTRSADFPTVTPLQPTYGGSPGFYGDAFVVAINSSGTQVLSSTYLGGEGEDVISAKISYK